MGFVGSSSAIRTPMAAFSRSITPLRSRRSVALRWPPFTEKMIDFVEPEPLSSWKKSRPADRSRAGPRLPPGLQGAGVKRGGLRGRLPRLVLVNRPEKQTNLR
jgi:hypothetical protein